MEKICIDCNERKAAKNRRKCYRCIDTKYRSIESIERRRIKTNLRGIKWNKNNRQRINDWRQNHRPKIKAAVLEMYGAFCVCCGENNSGFLTIDHINNDGHKEKKENTSARNIFEYLQHKPVDKNKYQVLCFNCNCGRAANNGICPHVEAELSGESVLSPSK